MKDGLRIHPCGDRHWFFNDRVHREDGPAEEWVNGAELWWFDGTFLGEGAKGFWTYWGLLTHAQRCNLNLHTWLAKYS